MAFRDALHRFFSDRSGATAIEYALIATLISTSIIGALQLIAPTLVSTFETVEGGLKAE